MFWIFYLKQNTLNTQTYIVIKHLHFMMERKWKIQTQGTTLAGEI